MRAPLAILVPTRAESAGLGWLCWLGWLGRLAELAGWAVAGWAGLAGLGWLEKNSKNCKGRGVEIARFLDVPFALVASTEDTRFFSSFPLRLSAVLIPVSVTD